MLTMKKKNAQKDIYSIFYVIEQLGKFPEKRELDRVEAASQDDACKQLYKWIKRNIVKHPEATGKKLYVEKVVFVEVLAEDGTSHMRELGKPSTAAKRPFYKRIWDKATATVNCWLVDRPLGLIQMVRDAAYFLKHRQNPAAYWNLDMELLDTIEHQLDRLLKLQHGIPQQFIDEALATLHSKPGEKFDAFKHCSSRGWKLAENEMKLSEKLQREAYAKITKAVKLYRLFAYAGDYQPSDAESEAFFLANRHLLPRVRGTYDVYDECKLAKLAQKQWKQIWQLIERYGQTMYD